MRVLLAISVIYHITIAQQVGINVPCNKELDGLLTADPDGDERAFMSCQGVGVGTIGFWERKLCPNNMVFDFINQQCKEQKKKARKQQTLSIAILNNSCANGETCIGGSVCDLDTLRCMCPYGTTPKLDTLSCESSQPPFVSATVDGPPAQFFNSFNGAQGNRNNNGFVPFPQQPEVPDFQPNNNFKFGNNQPNNNNFGNNQNNRNSDFNWNPNFNWNNNKQAPMNNMNNNNNNNGGSSEFNPFQPNPNQKFVFNFNKNQGGNMNNNNMNNMNNNNNQNVQVPEVKPKVATLVGIGALCSDLAECDHGSSCVMGRCTCVSPLVQHEGKCVLRQQQKFVGPGELCDNGEICGKGSVCDVMIPVCVCPAHTDLSNGECISVSSAQTTQPVQIMTPPPTLPPVQVPVQTLPPQTRPPPPPVQQTQPPIQTAAKPVFFQTTQPPRPTYMTTQPTTPFIPKQIYTAPPQIPKSSIKINPLKIGGSKQAGVGVRCSLNTDCMIGAYCNGNTNPPSCQCLSTHVNIEGRCEKVIYPGQVGCRSDLQCHAAHSGTHCIDRICVCPEGQKAVDQTCVSANEPITSPPGGSCSNLRECTGGSVCREGWCICPDSSMIVNRGICIQSGPKPTLPPRTSIPHVPLPPQLPISVHVPQVTITKAQPFVTEAPPQGKKIVPGGRCGPIDVCVGGSNCIEGFCLCPAGQQPSNNGRCEKFTTTSTSRQTTLPSTTMTTQGTTYTTTPAPPPPTTSVFSFTIADLLSTRRQPAFIEIPTHVPLTTTAIQTDDECTAIGLICKGNTVCLNKSCQCPENYVLHHDGCVSPEEAARRKARGKARHEATTARVYSKPGEACTQGQTCVGGSTCSFRKLCECPQDKSEISQGQCVTPKKVEAVPGASCNANTQCTKGSTCESGLCRCQPGYIAVSGNCVALPMSTTPKMKVMAKPLESCESGEVCEGGSSCDYDTGICMCPPGQIVFNVQCMPPPTQPQLTTRVTVPTKAAPVVTPRPLHSTDCEQDANCGENKICVSGKCKCRPGFVDNSGTCEPLEDIDVIERPIPVSYAKHKVATLSERMLPREQIEISNIEPVAVATPARQETVTQKPRIVGPPIRRPRPKNKNSGGSGGGGGGSGGSRSYKTGSGNANCPPGNEPTRDDSGKLIICNGLEPNCPPRSYCYITSGGFATEEYNCCKSW